MKRTSRVASLVAKMSCALAVDRSLVGRREQAVEVLHEGALARARVPNDGHELAGVESPRLYVAYGRLLEGRAHAVGVREVLGFYDRVHWRIPFPSLKRGHYGAGALVHRERRQGQLAAAGAAGSYMSSVVAGTAEPLAL